MNYSGSFRWTDETITRLKSLHTDGLSASQIAGVFGLTRNAIMGKLHRLRLTHGVGRARPSLPKREWRGDATVRRHIVEKLNAHDLAADALTDLPVDESPDAVTFLARKYGECRWPLNSVLPIDEFMVCGAATGSTTECERSYCLRHHEIAHTPYKPRAEAQSDAELARRKGRRDADARRNNQ